MVGFVLDFSPEKKSRLGVSEETIVVADVVVVVAVEVDSVVVTARSHNI